MAKGVLIVWMAACTLGVLSGRDQPPITSGSSDLYYRLTVLENNPRRVSVEANLLLGRPYLQMDQGGVPAEIPGGWAHFVDNLTAFDKQGRQLKINWEESERRWHLPGEVGQQIRVTYDVVLQHDQYDWRSAGGQDARPGLFDEATVFWVTKGLFIFPVGQPSIASVVDIQVPSSWTVSTAWLKDVHHDHRFKVSNIAALSSNCLVLGRHEEVLIRQDSMSITLAVATDLTHRTGLIKETLQAILPVYEAVFGSLPNTNYLICASAAGFEDGEAYYSSFHQIFLDDALELRRITWANVLAHEMFHYWNGTNVLVGKDIPSHYWFGKTNIGISYLQKRRMTPLLKKVVNTDGSLSTTMSKSIDLES